MNDKVLNTLEYNKIIEKLVLQIDAIDNGYFPEIKSEYHLTDLDKVIDLFNKSWIISGR